ncbi:hypothetical protein OKW34_008790 [Paraburkholderia youngii]|uniref:hypothetical protein n=1 Tax=Paraburkholderia youngii TaxID=2782701 RepID=UPI003D1DCDED
MERAVHAAHSVDVDMRSDQRHSPLVDCLGGYRVEQNGSAAILGFLRDPEGSRVNQPAQMILRVFLNALDQPINHRVAGAVVAG